MDNRNDATDFLGCGISFPPRVNPVTGCFFMTSGEDDIREAIKLILFTGKGERAMQPDFGCDIRQYAFSSMGMIDRQSMENEIKQSLIRWEPRIMDIEIATDLAKLNEGIVELHINYVVRSTNNPYNLVFPYYINEGV